jgi:hypothetical protein
MGAAMPQLEGIRQLGRVLRLGMSLVAGTCGVSAVALGLHSEDAPAEMIHPIVALTAVQAPHHGVVSSTVVARSPRATRSAPDPRTTDHVCSQVPIQPGLGEEPGIQAPATQTALIQPGLGGVPSIEAVATELALRDMRFQLRDAATAARHRGVSAEASAATSSIKPVRREDAALLPEDQRTVSDVRVQRGGSVCNHRVGETRLLLARSLAQERGQWRGRELDAHIPPS